MRQIASIIVLFICSYSFGQLQNDDPDDEYLFQAYNIYEVTIWNELVRSNSGFDSIQVTEGKYQYTIHSNSNILEYPAGYSVKMSRNKRRVKTIQTKYLTARFKYNLVGNIAQIKFKYGSIIRSPYYEGTTDYYEFEYEYEDGYLVKCINNCLYGSHMSVVEYF